jgi:phage repressor protein C with HTH and peptisase S24 domain
MAGLRDKLLMVIGDQSVNGWAENHGLPPQTVHEWIKNDRMPRKAGIEQLASNTGIPIKWWVSGDGPPPNTSYTTPSIKHHESNQTLPGYDTKKIRHYVNVRGSAGPGYSVEDETVIEVSVDTQLLRERFGTNFANIQIVGVRGDSMEPTLSHGDQVAVDTSCDRFIDDAIYAIQQNGDLRFKRIRLHLDGSIEVISDNERFQNINRPEIYKPEQLSGVHIIGRVIPLKFGLFKV